MEKLERVQYQAALALTGAWQGSNCSKLNVKIQVWRIWNYKHDWITSRSIRDKSDYSCKDGNSRYAGCCQNSRSTFDKVATTIAAAAKKRKRVDVDAKHIQEPQLKKSFVDTGGIDVNALIGGSARVFQDGN